MRYFLLFVLATIFSLQSYSQDNTTTPKKNAKKEANPKVKEDKPIEGKSKTIGKPKVPYRFMINLHGGIGLMNYFGDLRDKPGTTVHRVGNRAGYNFGIGANVTNWLELNANVLMGSVSWSQNASLKAAEGIQPKNFEAEVFTAGANLTYNFKNFIRDPQGITPFISVGVSYSDFDIYTDLQTTIKDANGVETTYDYHYWQDGLIRNVDQNSPATDDIFVIDERDFEHETPLSESPITSVAFPVGAGIDFNASRKFGIRIGAYYYFTLTDNMDNVVGNEKGYPSFIANDGFLYTSLSVYFKFDPFKKKPKKVEIPDGAYQGFDDLEVEDSDGDGVTDFFDRCEGTPKGLNVDANGCPADDDKDGIPNYRDKELNTPSGRVVAPNGVAISYKTIYETYGTGDVSLLRSDINQDWILSQPEEDSKYTVHVGTYTNYDIPTQLKIKLNRMEGLVEHKVNDSISVFTLGNYNTFEAAEEKKNELIESGIDEAFGVNQRAVPKVGMDLGVIGPDANQKQPDGISLDIEDVDVLAYGVELREYRLRIQLDKLSKLIAQHGVEMRTTEGGMKIYTIGSFSSLAEAETLQRKVVALGVKNPAISAKHNNISINLDKAKEWESTIKKATKEK